MKKPQKFDMAKVKSSGTYPEIVIQKLLRDLRIPFRKNVKSLPGSPDILIPDLNLVIFVNGCFWHGHEGCKYFRLPKSNPGYWGPKIQRTKQREREVSKGLEKLGFTVIVIWECELKDVSFFEKILNKILI